MVDRIVCYIHSMLLISIGIFLFTQPLFAFPFSVDPAPKSIVKTHNINYSPTSTFPISLLKKDSIIGIDGLVLNNTLSREGYEFYILFSHYWNPPLQAKNYEIVVQEYRKAGRNTILAIAVNNKELVYRSVNPNYIGLQGLAEAAANHISNYLRNGNHLKGIDGPNNLKDSKANSSRITSPFQVY